MGTWIHLAILSGRTAYTRELPTNLAVHLPEFCPSSWGARTKLLSALYDAGSLKRKVEGVAKDLDKHALNSAEEGSIGKRLKPHHDASTTDNGFAKKGLDVTSEDTGSQDEVTPTAVL